MNTLKEIILCIFFIAGPVTTVFGAFYEMYGLMFIGVGVFLLGCGLETLFKEKGGNKRGWR